jgi:hypothetical protein
MHTASAAVVQARFSQTNLVGQRHPTLHERTHARRASCARHSLFVPPRGFGRPAPRSWSIPLTAAQPAAHVRCDSWIAPTSLLQLQGLVSAPGGESRRSMEEVKGAHCAHAFCRDTRVRPRMHTGTVPQSPTCGLPFPAFLLLRRFPANHTTAKQHGGKGRGRRRQGGWVVAR